MANRRPAEDGIGERDHENTWGATEKAKENWADKNAEKVRTRIEKDNADKEADV